VALGLLGFAWADGEGMNRLPTSTTGNPACPPILEPEVPAGGIGFQAPLVLHIQVAVNLTTVTDRRDGDHAGAVVYRIDDPVVTDPRS
jgi:hypothetical protein